MLIFIEAAWHVLVQLAPWMLLGTLIAGLLHVLLPSGFVHRRLQGPAGVLKAVGIGVPLPLCSCGVIPAGIGLKKDGASDGACVGFLISTPQTGVDSILVSASFLGWPFALFKVLSAAVTGIVGGLLVDRFGTDTSVEGEGDRAQGPSAGTLAVAWRIVHHGVDIIRSIWLWLIFGILASAAIEVYVPDSFLTKIGSWGILPSALAALAISLPLYVCATASVPIAAALVAGGLPPGAALVFLMAGPATNVATMGAIFRQFGGRVLAIYMATIVAGSGIAAVAFDWLLSDASATEPANHEMHHAWWAQVCAVSLLGLFAWFLIESLAGRLRRRVGRPVEQLSEIKITVRGMRCGNCVARLEQVLHKVEGVHSAVVNLEPGEAIVRGSVGGNQLREAIREAGFQPD
jgi:uncharacterized membrane protein YraQ (UPF0718 family)/copper chaperone CopZ